MHSQQLCCHYANLVELANVISQMPEEKLKQTPTVLAFLGAKAKWHEMEKHLSENGLDLGALCHFVRISGAKEACPTLEGDIWKDFTCKEAMREKLMQSAVGWQNAKPATRRKTLLKATQFAMFKSGKNTDFKAQRKAVHQEEHKQNLEVHQQRKALRKKKSESPPVQLSLADSINLQTLKDRLRETTPVSLTQVFHAGMNALLDFHGEELQDLLEEVFFSRVSEEETVNDIWAFDEAEEAQIEQAIARCKTVELVPSKEQLFRAGLAALLEFEDEELFALLQEFHFIRGQGPHDDTPLEETFIAEEGRAHEEPIREEADEAQDAKLTQNESTALAPALHGEPSNAEELEDDEDNTRDAPVRHPRKLSVKDVQIAFLIDGMKPFPTLQSKGVLSPTTLRNAIKALKEEGSDVEALQAWAMENELLPHAKAKNTYKVQDIGKGPFALIPVSTLNAQKGQALKVRIEEGRIVIAP